MRNAIVVIADDIQLPPAAFLASRLAALKADRPIDVILATDSAKGLADLKAFGGGIVPLDISKLHAGVPMFTVGYFTRAVYHCLFVPSLLMGDYDRVLYLDVDSYPESDRVFGLFGLDMGRHALAAVRDLQVGFQSNDSNDVEVRDTIGADIRTAPGAKYLNSGVLLMQLRAWKREQIEKKALEIIRAGRPYLRYPDQTILNAIFQTRWLELSPAFNMITRAWASFVRRVTPPAIVHFTGAVKPWHRAFIDDHPVKQELAAFLAGSPWPDFIARANPAPLPGAGLPLPAERQLPLWQGRSLAALVRYLRETPFADVEQGITPLDLAALPEIP